MIFERPQYLEKTEKALFIYYYSSRDGRYKGTTLKMDKKYKYLDDLGYQRILAT